MGDGRGKTLEDMRIAERDFGLYLPVLQEGGGFSPQDSVRNEVTMRLRMPLGSLVYMASHWPIYEIDRLTH